MKHLPRLLHFKTLLLAGSLIAITLPVLNSCKSASKTTGSSSMKTNRSFADTSAMPSDSTHKDVTGGRDKKPTK